MQKSASPTPWRVAVNLIVILFLTLSFCFHSVDAKRAVGTANVVSNKVSKIAKFSFRPEGVSVIKGTVKYRGPEPRGSLYIFMDTEWGKLVDWMHTHVHAKPNVTNSNSKLSFYVR